LHPQFGSFIALLFQYRVINLIYTQVGKKAKSKKALLVHEFSSFALQILETPSNFEEKRVQKGVKNGMNCDEKKDGMEELIMQT
jgi:hypothetical protein